MKAREKVNVLNENTNRLAKFEPDEVLEGWKCTEDTRKYRL